MFGKFREKFFGGFRVFKFYDKCRARGPRIQVLAFFDLIDHDELVSEHIGDIFFQLHAGRAHYGRFSHEILRPGGQREFFEDRVHRLDNGRIIDGYNGGARSVCGTELRGGHEIEIGAGELKQRAFAGVIEFHFHYHAVIGEPVAGEKAFEFIQSERLDNGEHGFELGRFLFGRGALFIFLRFFFAFLKSRHVIFKRFQPGGNDGFEVDEKTGFPFSAAARKICIEGRVGGVRGGA